MIPYWPRRHQVISVLGEPVNLALLPSLHEGARDERGLLL